MITTGKFIYFNYTQYKEQEGRSYGFARSLDHERQIFLGTLYRVYPKIWMGQVKMSRRQNPEPLDLETPFVLEGRAVVIDTREVKKGLGGYWCFAEEWQMMKERYEIEQARRRAAEEERKRIEAFAEEARREFQAKRDQELTANPGTIAEALAHGWTILEKSPNGRQVRLVREFQGEKNARVITRYTEKKPARPQPCAMSRFAIA